MINNINISVLEPTEIENTIYMPEGFIDTVEHVLKRKGIHINEWSEQAHSTDDKEELFARINAYHFFKLKAVWYNNHSTREGWVTKGKYFYYRNKNTGEYELGTLDEFHNNAVDPSVENQKAMFIAYEKEPYKEYESRKLMPLDFATARWGAYVHIKYTPESFIPFCMDIVNDREGIKKMREEEEEEQRKADEEYRKKYPPVIAHDEFGNTYYIG